MRLALVATHHAEYAANLAWALARDHEVLLVLSRRNAGRQLLLETMRALSERLTLRTVPHHYAPLQPLIATLLRRHVERFRPDLVHLQEHPSRSPGMLAAALGGALPQVVTVHDPQAHSGADSRAAKPFERWNAQLRSSADRLIVHADRLVESMAYTQGDGAARVRVAQHGVLAFGRIAGDVTPTSPGDGLVFFGRMNRYKGLDTLLDANDRWLAHGFAPRLTIAGEGPELPKWRARIAAAPNIALHDRRLSQDELAALVHSAAAALLPYHDATGSGVAASAFGAGKPLLASDVGGLGEVVVDGANGLLVPPGDGAALAVAGHRLLTEPGLLPRLAEGARATATGALGWDAIAAHTAGIYREAIAAGR
jgi:glycosyltransferase involved in cell wall biosynthesis